jgi:hypothetical protein
MRVDDELGRLWKEAVRDNIKALLVHLQGGTEKNHKHFSLDR